MGACSSSSTTLEQKVSYLRESPFMLSMSDDELSHFAKFSTIRKYGINTKIFAQGSVGTEFFIIGVGSVEITALNEADRSDQFLCTKKKGDFFGEHAIMNDNHVRQATVSSSDSCTMLVFSKKSFTKYLSECSDTMRQTVKEMIGERMVNVVKKLPLFSSLSEWRLQLLGNLFRYRTLSANSVVFSEGDHGRTLFIISKGSVNVTSRSEQGQELTFAKLQAGAYFGEIALMVDMPRTATVTAAEPCLLLVLDAEDFKNFLVVVPDLADSLSKVVKDRTAEHFQKFNVPFFASIPRSRFKELSDCCTMQKYDLHSVIFNEGESGNAFYLMVWGQVSIQKEGREVGVLGPGKYFGEIALVTDVPRTATIIAKTKVVLLSLTKESFIKFFASNPEAYADFAIKISRYDVPLRSVLVHRTGREFFSQHLASEYSTENLEFWDEAGRFEVMDDKDPTALRAAAQVIIDKYVDGNAPRQVNIPSRCRDALMSVFQSPSPVTLSLFSEARDEVLKLMSSDSFKRFKESDAFEKLLEKVGTYSDAPQQKGGGADLEDVRLSEDDDDEDDDQDEKKREEFKERDG